MDYHLDALLNLPNLTVESCTQERQQVFETMVLNETSDCPHCQNSSDKLHQNRPVLIRDLPIFGQSVHLHLPRRQFYCSVCQRYFTERLSLSIGNDDTLNDMKMRSINGFKRRVLNK
jgi:transposase